jgi:hypothetical protein
MNARTLDCYCIPPSHRDHVNIKLENSWSFPTLRTHFTAAKNRSYQYCFCYPLDPSLVNQFQKVMLIRSRCPHLFDSSIQSSSLNRKDNQIFCREVTWKNGVTALEFVFFNVAKTAIISFEKTSNANGHRSPFFATKHEIYKTDQGDIYLGDYLSFSEIPKEHLSKKAEIFRAGFDSMLEFIKNENVDEYYAKLFDN